MGNFFGFWKEDSLFSKNGKARNDGTGTGGGKSPLDKLREHLRSIRSGELLEIVMDEAENNNDFRERLLERFTAEGMEWDFAELQQTAADLLRFNGFIEYRQSDAFSIRVQRVGMLLKSVMFQGHASVALDIIDFIIPKLEKAVGNADDSNGSIGGAIAQIAELRIEACRLAKPDPQKLAEKLFAYDVGSPWEWFGNFDGRYDAVLGEAGKTRYAELIRAEWEKLPDLEAGDSDHSSRRFALQTAMQRIAKENGEIELRLATAKKDLSSPAGYLDMVQLLRAAGRADEALAWAEKGANTFAGSWWEGRFSAFLADEYHRRGRDDDAIGIYWKMFIDRPACPYFELLRKQAELTDSWPLWRTKAMEHLHRQIKAADENTPAGRLLRIRRNGVLVEILISEKRYDEAWSQAGRYGCPEAETRALVAVWEKEHPADCIPACKLLSEKALVPSNAQAYSEAADELAHLGEIMARVNATEDFTAYMQHIRAKFKARKNLMRELDARGLP